MKRIAINKINKLVIIWLLLTVFVLPLVVQAIHIHHHHRHDICCKENGHHHHDCNNCPICNFTFSSFVKSDFIELLCTQALYPYEPAVCIEKIYISVDLSRRLRGPPRG
ncbi:MAG: hypothetical protein LBR10_04600 [Prevotellaceae bacterium]|nr:hypothetical protein [Prevotellaceae bacterium]